MKIINTYMKHIYSTSYLYSKNYQCILRSTTFGFLVV